MSYLLGGRTQTLASFAKARGGSVTTTIQPYVQPAVDFEETCIEVTMALDEADMWGEDEADIELFLCQMYVDHAVEVDTYEEDGRAWTLFEITGPDMMFTFEVTKEDE